MPVWHLPFNFDKNTVIGVGIFVVGIVLALLVLCLIPKLKKELENARNRGSAHRRLTEETIVFDEKKRVDFTEASSDESDSGEESTKFIV